MQRREFLKAAGAAGLLAGAARAEEQQAAAKPQGTTPALTVRRLAPDRFALDYAPREARPLRILQITDTHFGSKDVTDKIQDKRGFLTIRRIVDKHRPDFIVHTGDFINNDQGAGVSFEAIEFFDDLGVPWTHALGNHDIGGRSVAEFRQPMKRAAVGEVPTADGPQYAFRFDVLNAGQSDPRLSIFCFDSGYKDPNRKVSRPQLEWFEGEMRRDAHDGNRTPILAMIHIPVVEFEKLSAAGAHKGNFGERVCFDNDAGDTFAAFKKSQRVKVVFSGHDHKNDYVGQWDGIELAYGRVGGWNAYGDLPRGGRLIEVDLGTQAISHRLVLPDA